MIDSALLNRLLLETLRTRKFAIYILAILLLGSIYNFSHRSAFVRQAHPGDDVNLKLVILGVPLPYNDFTKKMYSRFYSPLIQRSLSKIPLEPVSGKISAIIPSTLSIIISRESGPGMLIHVPPSKWADLTGCSSGDTIHLRYATRPDPDNPFLYQFELASFDPPTQGQ